MEAATIPAPRMSISAPSLIPERESADGPVTTARLRRLVIAYTALVALGVALVIASGDGALTGLGLGLVAPGAGFLAAGHWLAFAATIPLFVVALALWLLSGNVLAPIFVWAGTAAGAAAWGDAAAWPAAHWVVPVAAFGLVGGAAVARRRSHRSALERRRIRNAYLEEARIAADAAAKADVGQVGEELSADELALARFVLDRALQPIESFDGFDEIEQFQTSSVRYQVSVMGYALSTLQYARTPSFHGYLSEAQRNLISKMQERICWAYWAKESLWGHLANNPDPIPRDNIMHSGWFAAQIAGYVSNTLDHRYSKPGSIAYRHPRGQVYEYDFHSIVAALVENFERSEFCLFPCEPNWIYTLCNGYTIPALPVHDRLYGTDYWERIEERFRRGYEEEMMTVDGRTVGIRSTHTGLSIPGMTSVLSDAAVIWQFNPVMPEVARRAYEILRREYVSIRDDGSVEIALNGWDKLDTGNYRRVPITAYNALMMASIEIGDTELFERLEADVERQFEPITEAGVRRYAEASVMGNSAFLLAKASLPGSHFDRVNRGVSDAIASGPVLADARYPDVLVARAVSDGSALELVLRPGSGAGRQSLTVERLRPGASYALRGAVEDEAVASADGFASFAVDLYDRREVTLAPVG